MKESLEKVNHLFEYDWRVLSFLELEYDKENPIHKKLNFLY